jgi:hypothetical protein
VIKVMNELAGDKCITLGGLDTGNAGVQKADQIADENMTDATHIPVMDPLGVPTAEEDAICDDVLDALPELEAQGMDEESDSEEEDDDSVVCNDDEGPDDITTILESVDSDTSSVIQEQPTVATWRTTRQNAGVKCMDEPYHWNLMNMSLGAAICNFGDAARDACKAELQQLFKEKKALCPVKWQSLSPEQKQSVIRSHMFLTEKYEDGQFVKVKARVVADGCMQDKTVYSDYSSPMAKTKSVMTCLKLAAVKGWDLLKLDVGGAFLCAPIDDEQEVFMSLGQELAEKAVECMPYLAEFVDQHGRLLVKVDKAMYGLIQSAKLWYKELTRYLMEKGIKKCKSNECVLVKQMENGEHLVVLIYVDDILVMGKQHEHRHWVKKILEEEYEKITMDEGDCLPYLGMTIVKKNDGYEISMKSYIQDVLYYMERK